MQDLAIASFILNFILIAITAIYVILTWRLSKSAKEQVKVSKDIHRISRIEKLNIFKTTLLAIKSELDDHEMRTEALVREIMNIQSRVKDVGDLVTNRTSIIYDAEFLDKCRDRVLEYEEPDFELFAKFSFYVNRCIEFNKDLTFERLLNSKQFLTSNDEYKIALNGYFEALKEHIKMLKKLRGEIQTKIIDVVINYLPRYLEKEMEEKYKIIDDTNVKIN